MSIIPTRIHAMIDYVIAVVLIVTPFVFLFEQDEAAKWVLIAVGIATFVSSLLTHDELGIAWAIPMPAHLGLDVLLGLFLIASPWLFGFAGDIWWPHVILGVIKAVVAVATRPHLDAGPSLPPQAEHRIAGQH